MATEAHPPWWIPKHPSSPGPPHQQMLSPSIGYSSRERSINRFTTSSHHTYPQDGLHNLWDQVQNENMGSLIQKTGFSGGASGKELDWQCRRHIRDAGSIPGLGRSPGGGQFNQLQCSCLENPTEEAGRLQSVGSQGIRYNWSKLAHTRTHSKIIENLIQIKSC